jgi:hypothetical protein
MRGRPPDHLGVGRVAAERGTQRGAIMGSIAVDELDQLVDQGLLAIEILCAKQREALQGIWL